MGGAFSTFGESRGAYGVLMVKPEKKRTLGKPRLRREDKYKLDLQKVGWGGGHGLD